MVFGENVMSLMLNYNKQSYSLRRMVHLLREEGLCASLRGIAKFVAHIRETGKVSL
jgi:hypothetical protein